MSWDELKGKIEKFCENRCTELKKKYDDLCRRLSKSVHVAYRLDDVLRVIEVVLDCEDRVIDILPPKPYYPELFIVGHLYVAGNVVKYAAHTNMGEKIAHLFEEESTTSLDTYVQRIAEKFATQKEKE